MGVTVAFAFQLIGVKSCNLTHRNRKGDGVFSIHLNHQSLMQRTEHPRARA